MPEFVPGLQLNNAFYEEVVRPIVARWPHAAARVGTGSDVLGYDDATSTDHGWGLLLRVFVAEDAVDDAQRAIDDALPDSFRDRPTRFRDPGDDRPPIHHVVVSTLRDWLLDNLGVDPRDGLTATDWLLFPQQKLLEVTRGQIYGDDAHELRSARSLLDRYPNDVWHWMLASQWRRIAQEEAFVGRAAEVGDGLGSRLIAARLARELMRIWFLLERVYWPYTKWFGTAFAQLPESEQLGRALEEAVAASDIDRREAALARSYEIAAHHHNSKGITEHVDPGTREYYGRGYRVLSADRFATACLDQVSSAELSSLPLVGSVDQALDTTDVLSHAGRARAMAPLYRGDL